MTNDQLALPQFTWLNGVLNTCILLQAVQSVLCTVCGKIVLVLLFGTSDDLELILIFLPHVKHISGADDSSILSSVEPNARRGFGGVFRLSFLPLPNSMII